MLDIWMIAMPVFSLLVSYTCMQNFGQIQQQVLMRHLFPIISGWHCSNVTNVGIHIQFILLSLGYWILVNCSKMTKPPGFSIGPSQCTFSFDPGILACESTYHICLSVYPSYLSNLLWNSVRGCSYNYLVGVVVRVANHMVHPVWLRRA